MDDYYNDNNGNDSNDDSSTEAFLLLLLLVHNIDTVQAVIMGTYSHSVNKKSYLNAFFSY